jgi:murein DD-endopeptidase MepM/ murein hydrolase activator NlpD
LDVWSDDVLKEVLRETRRQRSHRRWQRLSAVGVALTAGAALAWFVTRTVVDVSGSMPIAPPVPVAATVPPTAPTIPPPAVELSPVIELLANQGAPTPVIGAAPALVDLAMSLGALPAAAAPAVDPDPLVHAARELATVSGLDAALDPPAASPIVEDRIQTGDTLIEALSRYGVGASTVAMIVREMKPHFDFRRARPGHRFRLERGEDGALLSFRYDVSAHEHYELVQRDGGGFEARGAKRGTVRQQARLAGIVATTLHDAIEDLGERPQLAARFANIFAWDVDFAKGTRPGDEFQLLYERNYVAREGGEGGLRYVGPGRILAARYTSGGRTHEAIYYETAPGAGSYYRPDGGSVQEAFLAAPVKYTRITSSFTQARFHPILRRTRPHPGIDYAAPAGTPVWAVASGRVTHVGWMGGYGRLVKIQHADGYESYYAHLSGFAKGLHVGQTVSQKQVIGNVGSSGLSTGPHVCFRITRHGQFVNPASTRIPTGDRVASRQRQDFETVRDARLAQLGPATRLVATDDAM